MMKDNEGQSASADGPSPNPYQPPAPWDPTGGMSGMHSSLNRPRTASLPDGGFWGTAFAFIAVFTAATFVTYGLTLPIVIALLGGVVRVCIIYQYRAGANLPVLPANRLLFSSTVLTLALLSFCLIAFCAVCTTGTIALEMNATNGITWMIACVIIALITFVFLFAQSIRLAL